MCEDNCVRVCGLTTCRYLSLQLQGCRSQSQQQQTRCGTNTKVRSQADYKPREAIANQQL